MLLLLLLQMHGYLYKRTHVRTLGPYLGAEGCLAATTGAAQPHQHDALVVGAQQLQRTDEHIEALQTAACRAGEGYKELHGQHSHLEDDGAARSSQEGGATQHGEGRSGGGGGGGGR